MKLVDLDTLKILVDSWPFMKRKYIRISKDSKEWFMSMSDFMKMLEMIDSLEIPIKTSYRGKHERSRT